MNPIRILALVLIVAGVLGLLYGGYTYTQSSHDLKVGNVEFSVKDKRTLNVPVWVGVGAIATGALLFFVRPSSA